MKKIILYLSLFLVLAGAGYGSFLFIAGNKSKAILKDDSTYFDKKGRSTIRVRMISTERYNAFKNRDPFTDPEQTEVYKDAILSNYSLNNIILLGIVKENNRAWAILSPRPIKGDKNDNMDTYKAELNSKVSRSGAVLDKINEHSVELTKNIKTSGGIKKRHIELTIGAPKQ